MIKLLEFVQRKPGVSSETFHTQWRENTERFFAETAAARRLVVRCELNHRLPEDYARSRSDIEAGGTDWDGIQVQWFESQADLEALRALPAYQAFAAAERENYRGDNSIHVLTRDAITIVDKPGGRARAGLKLMCILRRNAALSHAQFLQHWRGHHGGLFQNIPELNEPVLAYDQNPGLDIEGAAYHGLTEQWFVSLPEWIESIAVPANDTVVLPDVQYMLDLSGVQFILAGRPSVVVGA